MQTSSKPANSKLWRELYVAALFESDHAKLTDRIADAEQALATRARELFYESGDHIEEEEALDNAMYSLNALRNVYRYRQASAQSQVAA